MKAGSNSISGSIALNKESIPRPFTGGSNSKENSVDSDDEIFSVSLI